MLRVMLCGAEDTDRLREEFSQVVLQFGGEPWHFSAGRTLHLNTTHASWQRNSSLTVARADLCVFVIVEKYGEIAWETELRTALITGKPFLIMCLEQTYHRYLTLRGAIVDRSAITNSDDRQLIELISSLESEQRQTTVIPFRYGTFDDELRHQLAALFLVLLGDQEKRNRHGNVAQVLGDPTRLTVSDLAMTQEVALDEMEDKAVRKRAVQALAARHAADIDTVRALLSSTEQGVQRLTAHLLADLVTADMADGDFLEYCVSIANGSDDVGIVRRMIPAILKIDLAGAIRALSILDTTEIGTRRRLAETLEEHEEAIRREGLSAAAIALLDRCLQESRELGWKARCRDLQDRLGREDEDQ